MNQFQLKSVVRAAPRAAIPATASLHRRGKMLGEYTVANLSSSGALLVDGPPLTKRGVYQMRLHLPGSLRLPVDCQVRRHQISGRGERRTGVSFIDISPDMEYFLHNLVLAQLADGPQRTTRALLIDDVAAVGSHVQGELQALGMRVERAVLPLDIIRSLREFKDTLRVVVIRQTSDFSDGAGLLKYLQQAHPQIRSFLLADGVSFGAPSTDRRVSLPTETSTMLKATGTI